MIYFSNNASKGWDESFKGEPAQNDVYEWKPEIMHSDKQEFMYIGKINLIS